MNRLTADTGAMNADTKTYLRLSVLYRRLN